MKKAARKIIEKILWLQVKRLRAKNHFKVIAVAGSTGKTSTKLAIAQTLEPRFKVLYQEGNYNVPVSVPLIFFDQPMPPLFNPFAWLKVFIKNESILKADYKYEVVVVELGTDQPGDLAAFVPNLTVDIGVLTSIAPEHMEFFGDMDAVAAEELTLARMSEILIYNTDLCPAGYMSGIKAKTYGINQAADLRLEKPRFVNDSYSFDMDLDGPTTMTLTKDIVSFQQLYSVLAAITVGKQLGMDAQQISQGLQNIQPVSGRMRKLDGINSSILLDDTYNASPQATLAALDTLYSLQAPYKMAVLGNMNELGDFSEKAHIEVGQHCDPKQLNLVITIGPDANKYLAASAEKAGCKVIRFDDPYSAAEYLKSLVKAKSLILFKGSQNNVFAEEAIKPILANPADSSKLVRQSPYWLKRKKNNFRTK